MRKYLALLPAVIALSVFGGLSFALSGDGASGSSADRTIYSAVYALKHKNFGRFCSYLSQDLRSDPYTCSLNNAAGWGQNVVFFSIDIFGPELEILPGYKVVVDEDTVTYVVKIELDRVSLDSGADPYYLFMVELQDSGKWRISKITASPNLAKQAALAEAQK